MRAYSDNEDLALLSGISPERVVMITWIIAAILATVAGALYGLDKSFKPFTYFNNLLPIFAAAIVGGIGNPLGAFLGGYVIAFSEIVITYAYKKFFAYLLPESLEPNSLIQLLSTDYKFAVSFSILVVVLLFRPSGIFKGRTYETIFKCFYSLYSHGTINYTCWHTSILGSCTCNTKPLFNISGYDYGCKYSVGICRIN
jgi:branched-chain amino acid transport system permease protein